MKLIAIAASTATGFRVVEPAPGFINEQGGYWADQTSDQSRHYPQAPQISNQAPQVDHQQYQKPQCCTAYEYTLPGGEKVWMEKAGENEGMDVWKGEHNGKDIFVYYEYSEFQINGPLLAYWAIGAKVGDKDAIKGEYTQQHRYCPHERNGWGSNPPFECRQSQQPQQPDEEDECCSKFVFNDWESYFTQVGEHAGKPIYTTMVPKANNSIKTLFWRFDNVPDNRPREAVPGTWCFGDDVNDTGASVSSKTLGDESTCPDQKMNTWTLPMNLKCSTAKSVDTCDQARDREFIFDQENTSSCNVEALMWNLAGAQADQVAELMNDGSLRTAFDLSVVAWMNLVNDSSCGFVGTNGFAPDCSSICSGIKELINAKEFAPVLNQFIDYTQIFFAVGDNSRCTANQEIIYTELAKFQKAVGTLTNLPDDLQES